MPSFAEALDSGRFLITAELNPPKGTDLTDLIDKAESLKGMIDAFNLTDSASSIMGMAPVAASYELAQRGIESILQVAGRDRNRIAIQGDLLAAYHLGARNVLCMGGDPPSNGDHPDAKGVFDLNATGILQAVAALNDGKDMNGNPLKGGATICAGAVVNPGASDLDGEIGRMEDKIKAGARFFQTQAVYDVKSFETFMDRVKGYDVAILAGFIILKSGDMARRLNATLPGISVPDALIEELDAAPSKPQKSIEISGRIISELASVCRGVHVMAIGWESRIPAILQAAGLGAVAA